MFLSCLVTRIYYLSFPLIRLADGLFNLVLYEMSHGPVRYDGYRLESLLFNPIDRRELGNVLSSHLYPDSNLESRLPFSNYVVEGELYNQSSIANNADVFSIMHINVRSLLKNLD